jgi:hypothetical protein
MPFTRPTLSRHSSPGYLQARAPILARPHFFSSCLPSPLNLLLLPSSGAALGVPPTRRVRGRRPTALCCRPPAPRVGCGGGPALAPWCKRLLLHAWGAVAAHAKPAGARADGRSSPPLRCARGGAGGAASLNPGVAPPPGGSAQNPSSASSAPDRRCRHPCAPHTPKPACTAPPAPPRASRSDRPAERPSRDASAKGRRLQAQESAGQRRRWAGAAAGARAERARERGRALHAGRGAPTPPWTCAATAGAARRASKAAADARRRAPSPAGAGAGAAAPPGGEGLDALRAQVDQAVGALSAKLDSSSRELNRLCVRAGRWVGGVWACSDRMVEGPCARCVALCARARPPSTPHSFVSQVEALEGLAQKHYDATVAASTRAADSMRTAGDAHQQALEQVGGPAVHGAMGACRPGPA